MMTTTRTGTRRVALYLRVSSDDQAERGTIATQAAVLRDWLARESGAGFMGEYRDEGWSGNVPLAERPAGARLLADARAGTFDEIWVYKLDRLGRRTVDLAYVKERFDDLGIRLISAQEGEPDAFMYDIQSAVAANERRVFLRRSADGMRRAAEAGRYTGGIVAFGYRIEGSKQTARFVPDTAPLAGEWSAAGVVRHIYRRLALEGGSCVRVAEELNALGIPTHYARDKRLVGPKGQRKERTQGVWRHGRIRNMVTNPLYKGELQYGRRSKKTRDIIRAAIEPLVSPEMWQAAQETIARNRTIPRNTTRHYLLRSVIRCAACGLHFVGTQGHPGETWYRCGGKTVNRGPLAGLCSTPLLRGELIEPVVRADVERWLRDPGDVLADLEAELEHETAGAVAEAESITIERGLSVLAQRRARLVAALGHGAITEGDIAPQLAQIETEREALQSRLDALQPSAEVVPSPEDVDLLSELRRRLDAGLTDEQWHEIVRLLVMISVETVVPDDGSRPRAKAIVSYKFPAPVDVVQTSTGRDSSPRSVGSGPGRRSPGRPA